MKYLCLVHIPGGAVDALDDAAKRQLDRDSLGYDKELMVAGHFIAAEALRSSDSAVLVRVRGGEVSTTDGPFIETKEQLGGFILVEARDMNEAIRIASGIPLAKLGTIEVRPIYNIEVPESPAP